MFMLNLKDVSKIFCFAKLCSFFFEITPYEYFSKFVLYPKCKNGDMNLRQTSNQCQANVKQITGISQIFIHIYLQ